MKSLVAKIFLFVLFTVNSACAQDYNALISQADSLYKVKNYPASLDAYNEAFKLQMKNPLDLYNAACSAALTGDKDKAFTYLNTSFDIGWTNINHAKQDPDLTLLRPDSRWDETIAKLQAKLDILEANYDKPLQQELLEILRTDQLYRVHVDSVRKTYGNDSPQLQELWKKILEIDSVNTLKVTNILDTRGWVGRDVVGNDANMTIFLVIQHAELPVQEKYLPMMREAVKNGNAKASSLALLEDRVLLRNGKKQLYGSQVGYDEATKTYHVQPLEDPDNVDKRRAEMGLGPLANYVKNWGIVWNVEEFKKQNEGK